MTKITLLFLFLFASLLAVAQEWQTNGTSIYNTNAGNVGIGTATPTAKLDINGNLVLGDHSTDPVISFVPSDNSPRPTLKHTLGTGFLYNVKSGEGHYFQDGGSTTNMFVGGDGNVGIGTVVPEAKLHIQGTPWTGIKIKDITTTGGRGTRNQFLDGNDDGWQISFGGHYEGQPLRFAPIALGSVGEATFSLLDNGNVGIGTTTPSKKLELVGTNNTLRIWKGTGFPALQFSSDGDGTNNNASVGISSYGYGGSADLIHYISNWGGNYYYRFGSSEGAYNVAKITKGGGGSNGPPTGYGIFEVFTLDQQTGIRLDGNGSTFFNTGNVGIGTTTPDSELTVKGTIHTQEVKVDLNGAVAPDYVFADNYALPELRETEAYIRANKHLPGIPSAAEMEDDGINLKEMNLKLLEKVEELTLYLIELKRENEEQQKQLDVLLGKQGK